MMPSSHTRNPHPAPPHTAIVDAHPLAQDKLVETVERLGGRVAWTAGTAREALECANGTPLDCVIFEFALPDSSGARLLAALRMERIRLRGVALSAHDSIASRALTQAAGALGYLSKTLPVDALARALQDVWRGRTLWTAEDLVQAEAWWARYGEPWRRLSPRQRGIAVGVAAHLTNKEMAFALALQESTVKGYLLETLAKLRLTSRGELAAWMRAGGLADPLLQPLLELRDIPQLTALHRLRSTSASGNSPSA
jgi:DNA-binding NarL/FixJ family response regulator